ncbi:MAG: alpha-glucosidase [Clostridia bacterium]|nr:alpha-glucosidase [Clostridia bacterium]
MPEIKKNWYKEMSVYQIWTRSFCDGDGDGIGDLKGVLSKLDYIKSLGVDAIWFSPIYKSPQKDYGYDISDYRQIAPEYGTMDDFKAILDGAHERGLKVIMDLVINHTSDQHEWFKESLKGEDNPYHDYYIWRKGKGKNPPNNWKSTFPGPAWEYNADLDKYYLHLFAVEQCDLNMDNPAVRNEVKDIMRFWLDMGVDGFREDVITYISKREGLPNGFPLPVACGMEHFTCGPHLYEYLQEFNDEVLSKYDIMTVGEAPMMTPDLALKFIDERDSKKQVLKMMFNFQHMEADCIITSFITTKFSLKKLKSAMSNWQTKLYGKGWNALYLENHDQPRIISRYGNEKYRVESGKMLATMYICQSGTPFIYQGQEIGMTNIRLPELDMYVDVATYDTYNICKKLGFPHKSIMKRIMKASRDNARTPVQWTSGKNAGFTTADKPWFYINDNYTEVNVEDAEKDPNSILNYYRKLLKFRKENEIVIYGDFKEHYHESDKLYVYERNYEGKKLLVICSFSDRIERFKAPKGFDLAKGKVVLGNYDCFNSGFDTFNLRPYETKVFLFE